MLTVQRRLPVPVTPSLLDQKTLTALLTLSTAKDSQEKENSKDSVEMLLLTLVSVLFNASPFVWPFIKRKMHTFIYLKPLLSYKSVLNDIGTT